LTIYIGGQVYNNGSRVISRNILSAKSTRLINQAYLYSSQFLDQATIAPFAYCSMDFITSLPFSKGYDSILSIVDHGMSKGIVLIPCKKTITADSTTTLLLNHLYCCFGLLDKAISD